MKRKNGYVKLGLTAFLTVSAILLFYDTLFGRRAAIVFGGKLLTAVQPILIGAMIAYLLTPIVNFFERQLFRRPARSGGELGRLSSRGVRAVSLVMTWAVICVLFYLLGAVLLPELYKSIVQLAGNVETYYSTVSGWVQHLLETYPDVAQWVTVRMDSYFQDIGGWLENEVLPRARMLMTAVSGGVVSALSFLKDLLVGVIVSVYLLATKERCAAYSRKVAFGVFSEKNVHWVLRGVRKVDDIFSGFVRGKLLDSLIIGIICFVCSTLFNFPYAPLVSVIVGVTNVIPFFGPFLGAIPSLFLILLVSPLKALYFLVFILALQQVDGNIIGPKILGNKTGLSSLWVIIAILVGGSFFGLPGMFFGVPVCACLYSALTFFVETRLRRRGLPTSVDAYTSARGDMAPPGPPSAKDPPPGENL